MSGRLLIRIAAGLAICMALAIAAFDIRLAQSDAITEAPDPHSAESQLCQFGEIYAKIILRVARLHFDGGSKKTPELLLDRVQRLQCICGDRFEFPAGFADLAARAGRRQPPLCANSLPAIAY